MTPVVVDASAGVELIANTVRGRQLRRLLPREAVPWVPDHFFADCGAVLRRWDLSRRLTAEEVARAVAELIAWPVRVVEVRGLFSEAWSLRQNVTLADALYVGLARHLDAPVVTDDQRLVRSPGLSAELLHLEL